jgi:replication factor A1
MFIKDLQARQTNVDVEGEVMEMSDVREFSKYGKQGRVANAIIKDGSGKVKLSLWNEQIDKVKVGDIVKITNGYVSEFQGELQLTTGKFGTLDVTSKDDIKPAEDSGLEETEEEVPAEEEPAKAPEPEPTPEPTAPAPSAPEPAAPAEPAEEEKKKPAPEESLDVEEEDLT